MDKEKLENLIKEGKDVLATRKKLGGTGFGADMDYVDNALYTKWMTKVEILLKKESDLESYIVKKTGWMTTNYDLVKEQLAKLEGILEALF